MLCKNGLCEELVSVRLSLIPIELAPLGCVCNGVLVSVLGEVPELCRRSSGWSMNGKEVCVRDTDPLGWVNLECHGLQYTHSSPSQQPSLTYLDREL